MSLLDHFTKLNQLDPTNHNGHPETTTLGVRTDEYCFSLMDDSFLSSLPFVVTPEITDLVHDLCSKIPSQKQKALQIYRWMRSSIGYGTQKQHNGYRNSIQVFNDQEGVCGEQTALYLTMARLVGIRGSYTRVYKDDKGEHVNHACALIDVPGQYGQRTLVDPAYSIYDVNHQSIEPLTDKELFRLYQQWR